MYLLDNNVFREISKDRGHPRVVAWRDSVADDHIFVPTVLVYEVMRGAEIARRVNPEDGALLHARASRLFEAMRPTQILSLNEPIAELWGTILGPSNNHVMDMAYVATAQHFGLILVTRNLKHMGGRGVPTLDPFKFKEEKIP